MSKGKRFKLRDSDQSGFTYLESEMVKEKGSWIGNNERDNPPPSKLSLGGEGDVSRGSLFRDSTASTVTYENPTFFITAAGGITPTFEHPYMRVSGSNSAITISANPKISIGQEGQVLTLFCTDSNITITNGNGVATMASIPIVLNSGAVAVFMFNTGNNAWNETSRTPSTIGIGG